MTIPTSNTSFPLPHPTLTPIHGKPTAATLKGLKKEVYANARAVYSEQGGGLNGHLGVVMPTAQYVICAGIIFDEADHPSPQPIHNPAATSAQITATNRAYDQGLADFKTGLSVKEHLCQQILTAVQPIYFQ
jgi:hypothetical protein